MSSRASCPARSPSVEVGEDDGRAALLVDGVVQSISPADGLVDGGYWAEMVPDERPRTALILGMGGGTLAHMLQTRWGQVQIVGVDDDAAVVEAAIGLGWLPRAGVEVLLADAFAFAQTCERRFDFVAVDLFRGERQAVRAFGKPFLRRVRALLEPRGRLAVNMFLDSREQQRRERIAALFDIRDRRIVGGNVVIHARRRTA